MRLRDDDSPAAHAADLCGTATTGACICPYRSAVEVLKPVDRATQPGVAPIPASATSQDCLTGRSPIRRHDRGQPTIWARIGNLDGHLLGFIRLGLPTVTSASLHCPPKNGHSADGP